MSVATVDSSPAVSAPAVAVLIGGVALLAARPVLAYDGHPVGTLVVLFVALLAAGMWWPERAVSAGGMRTIGIVAMGVAAFGAARVLGGGSAPAALTLRLALLTALAAVAEEAFFRRFAYGLFERIGGATFALIASSLLFAAVHVSVYGWWVAPLDLAAGLLFGWQRMVSDRWWVSAATHVAANLMMVL